MPLAFVLLAALLFSNGCATYTQTRAGIEADISAGRFSEALTQLEKNQKTGADRVLYLLDRAMLLRLTGDYAASNSTFEQAKQLMDALSATSVTETTTSFLINDATRAYVGEPFERALLHVYAALNYIDLQQTDAARVEALQVDVTLKALRDDDDSPLAQDPFARYLAGIIYELRGEHSDALIAYRKAYEVYRAHGKVYGAEVPRTLQHDLLRLTKRVGLQDEHDKLRGEFGLKDWQPPQPGQAEVIVLLHNGLAPIKREQASSVWSGQASHVVSIALPYYQPRTNDVIAARVAVADHETRTERAENIEAIAVHTLKEHIGAITARAVARAVAKYQVSRRARQESGLAGLVMDMTSLFTERADTRSWLTLPGEIQIARVRLPAGTHAVEIELESAAGGKVERRQFDVDLKPGEIRVLSSHYIPSYTKRRAP